MDPKPAQESQPVPQSTAQQQPVVVQTPAQPVNPHQEIDVSVEPTPVPKSGNAMSKILFILIAAVLFILVAGVSYYLGTQQGKSQQLQEVLQKTKENLAQQAHVTKMPLATPTVDPTASWSAYTGSDFTLKYPQSWTMKKNSFSPYDIYFYDPATGSPTGNGGGIIYKDNLDMVSITSSQTPQEYIDSVKTKQDSALAGEFKNKTITLNGKEVEVYYIGGEGTVGWYIPFSNGKQLIVFGPLSADPSSDSIELQIVKTFTFTQ